MKKKLSFISTHFGKELKSSLFISWTIVTVATTLTIVFPLIASKQSVLTLTPTCISKSQFNIECSLCGMSRAFIEISNGHINSAMALNSGSIFLYLLFVGHLLFYIGYVGFSDIHVFKHKSKKDISPNK